MKHLFLFLALVFSNITFSQTKISGKIINQNHEYLPYCTVEFLSYNDTSLLSVVSSDSVGVFSVSVMKQKEILVRVSFIGYNQLIKSVILDSMQNQVTIDDLILKSNLNSLNEVEVIGKKSTIEKKIDRLVFNVENTIVTKGSSSYEVLSKTPMVQVIGNNISVIGKGSVGILFNDKYFYLSGEDLINFLKSVPADNIVRIEVITNPPAKYEASGGALINIITKKSKLLGTNGSINTSYTQGFYPTGQMGLNINNRRRKTNIYGNVSYSKGATRPMEKTEMYYPTRTFSQIEYTKRNFNSLNATAGGDYEFNPKNTISALYSTSIGNVIAKNNSRANYMQVNKVIDSTMLTNNNYNKLARTHSININYTNIIDSTGKKINIDADYLRYYNKRERNFNSSTYNEPLLNNSSNSSNFNLSTQLINIGTLKVDIEWPNKILNTDYGFKLDWITNNSNNSLYNNLGTVPVFDTTQSNNFIYDEKTQAAYLNVSKEFKKIELQVGLRFENTALKGYTPSTNDKINTVNRNYINLFPTAYLLYKIDSNNTISASYDRRIDRPMYSALNPFRYYLSPYIYSEGNPYLKPSYFNNIDVTLTLRQRYIIGASYNGMLNSYSEVPVQIDQNSLAYLQKNVGNTYQYTAYCVIPITVGQHIEGSVVFGYVNSNYLTTLPNYVGSKKSVLVSDLNGQFYWGKDNRFSAEIAAHMLPFGSTFAITQMGHQYVVDAGLKIKILENRAYISLGVNDIFNESTPSGQTTSNDVTILLNNKYDTRNFRLAFSYKFGYKGNKNNRERDKGNGEETNRIKGL